MTKIDTCSPGSHPHSDRPNWHAAETIEEYVENCREGLEQYSDRRAAKLLGWSRTELWRAKLISTIPDGLFEFILEQGRPAPSVKALAQVALALQRGGNNIAEVERCPHCGGVLRIRGLVSNKLTGIVNQWLRDHSDGVAP